MPRLLKAAVFGLLVAAIGVVASFLDLAHELEENSGLGLLFRLRGAKPAPPDRETHRGRREGDYL